VSPCKTVMVGVHGLTGVVRMEYNEGMTDVECGAVVVVGEQGVQGMGRAHVAEIT